MVISPEELMTRLGVLTPLFSADERGIIAALNDKDRGHVFAIDRESGNFRWRVENVSGWVIAPPLIWEDLYILGTSTVQMARQEKDEPYATVDWSRGGSIYAFEAESGRARFWDERTGVVRETPRIDGDVLIVEGEIRIGGFSKRGAMVLIRRSREPIFPSFRPAHRTSGARRRPPLSISRTNQSPTFGSSDLSFSVPSSDLSPS